MEIAYTTVKVKVRNRTYEIVKGNYGITVYSNLNGTKSNMSAGFGYKVFKNIDELMKHYKTFDEEILASLM